MSATVSPPNAPGPDDDGQAAAADALAPAAFGQFLTAARLRSGLSLEDVSASTKVAVRRLEALEQGAIDELPGGVYRRAWVRNYAAAVGLSPDLAIEQFDRAFSRPSPVAPPPPGVREQTLVRPRPRPRAEVNARPSAPAGARVNARQLLAWGAPVVVLIAVAVSVVPLLRSIPDASAVDDESPLPVGVSGAMATEPGTTTQAGAARLADVMLVPDVVPEAPVVDPRLVVTSRPTGARVTVNGVGWGVTPLTIRNLPPGPKVIRATKDGYVGREARVEFGLTGSNETVRLTLRPLN